MKKLWETNAEINADDKKLKERMVAIVGEPMTYKKMCESLGETYYTGGTAKTAQLSHWRQYADIFVSSHPTKYTIEQMYDKPLITQNDKQRFVKYIEALIISYMAERGESELVTTKMNFLDTIGMVNSNFTFLRKTSNQKELAKYGVDGLDKKDVEDLRDGCFVASQAVLLPWLERAIKSMRNRSIIVCADAYMIVTEDSIGLLRRRKILAVNDVNSPDYEISCITQKAYNDAYKELERRYPSLQRYNNHLIFNWAKQLEEELVVGKLKEYIPDIKHIYKCLVVRSQDDIVKSEYPEAKRIINEESKRKLRHTVAFDRQDISKATVSRLLAECIELAPDVDYEYELDKKKEQRT